MALWGAYVGWRAPGLAATTSALVVTTLLLTVTLVDFQVRKIPKELIVALLVWAVVQALWLGRPSLAMAGLGMAIGGGIFFLLAQTSRGAMGMGDVKLMAAGGALTGIPLIFPAMLLGVLAGGTAALVLLLTRRVTRKTPIAYGPYLSLGTWLALTQLWGLWPGWQM
jgi:prepilin signal peptidase PulO-like enzyme (type II secretory pathway)